MMEALAYPWPTVGLLVSSTSQGLDTRAGLYYTIDSMLD